MSTRRNTNLHDLQVEDGGNVISLLIISGATVGGLLVGWFSKHFLGRKQLKQEVKEVIKAMTREEINQIFSGAEEPKVTVKHVKTREMTPVQS